MLDTLNINGQFATLFFTGLACIMAAIVGGGLRVYGIEFPLLNSLWRQIFLSIFGGGLLVISLYTVNASNEETQWQKLENMIEPASYLQTPVPKTFNPQPGCTVSVTELLKVNQATLNKDLNKISISYSCHRPDHTYNCGGGLVGPTDSSYSANVSADVSVVDGVVNVLSVIDDGANPERACGSIITQHLESLDGISLQSQ